MHIFLMFMDILLHAECPKCNYKKAVQVPNNAVYCTECDYNGPRKEAKLVTVKDYLI